MFALTKLDYFLLCATLFPQLRRHQNPLLNETTYLRLIGKELANALDGILELQRSFFLKNFSGSNVVVTPPYFTSVKTCQRSEC